METIRDKKFTEIYSHILGEIERGSVDRKHGFHLFNFSTYDEESGYPDSRIVVLRKLIKNNLEQSGIVDKKNYNKIISKIYGNYGRILAEYPFLKAFRNSKLNKFIEIDGLENLNKIKREKRRAVFISGHFNNFELMALQIEKAGINLCAIYRPLNNVFLNKTMEEIRENFICKNQIKKGRSGTRQIIENIKKGNSVALMIDQRVREGIKINFFGKPASTTTIPAQLIKKYKCDLVPIYIERRKNNYFKMFVSEPVSYTHLTLPTKRIV